MTTDYSIFDRVVAPVMIASPEFRVVYSNEFARRSFPFLAAPSGLTARYSPEELAQARCVLQQGKPYLLKYNEEAHFFLLLEPELLSENELLYICVYVVSDIGGSAEPFPYLTDGELVSRMEREVAEPMNVQLKQLRILEQIIAKGNVEKSIKALQVIQQNTSRMTMFFGRMKNCTTTYRNFCILSDAVNALRSCNQYFPNMKYKAKGPCYIPMEKDAQILLYVDVLTNLICRQDKPTVTVTSELIDGKTCIEFASGPLNKFIDEPYDDDFDGIDIGLFSVRRRVEAAGGEISVKKRKNSGVIISLRFPKVNLLFAETSLFDSTASHPTDLEISALQYLQFVVEKYSE